MKAVCLPFLPTRPPNGRVNWRSRIRAVASRSQRRVYSALTAAWGLAYKATNECSLFAFVYPPGVCLPKLALSNYDSCIESGSFICRAILYQERGPAGLVNVGYNRHVSRSLVWLFKHMPVATQTQTKLKSCNSSHIFFSHLQMQMNSPKLSMRAA